MRTLHLQQQPFAAARQQRRGRSAPASARFGGGGSWGGGGYGGGSDPRLIIPGQEAAGNRSGRLVVPGQNSGAAPRPGGGLLDSGSPPVQQQFRPPPGFMDADGPAGGPELNMSADEMLNRLRAMSGHWYELARYLPALARSGIDGLAVEEATGLERKVQNVWATAAQVYESIRSPGLLTPEELAHYDVEGEYLLYELRFLSVRQRAPAAAYIAENNLSPQECQVLARAIKEYERRNGAKEGFSDTPGDVLAYKYFRDAQECRRMEDVQACVSKGLSVADSEDARAKLASLMEEEAAPAITLPTAVLTMLRLTRDELGFRPLAVAGELQVATGDQVLSAPKVSSEGVFGNFRIPHEGLHNEWVALPNWSVLTLAAHPVALSIRNCADVPEIREAASVKTEEEMKRLSGQGMLVVDIAADSSALAADKYYLAEDGSGRAQLVTGSDAASARRVLGPVLFVCRPPSRESAASATAELMSL